MEKKKPLKGGIRKRGGKDYRVFQKTAIRTGDKLLSSNTDKGGRKAMWRGRIAVGKEMLIAILGGTPLMLGKDGWRRTPKISDGVKMSGVR